MEKRVQTDIEKPSDLIRIIQGKQLIHDIVPLVTRTLRDNNINFNFQGHLSDRVVTYMTHKGVFHGLKFVDEDSVKEFKRGLELAGYETYGNTARVFDTNMHLSTFREEPKGIQGAIVLGAAEGFYELYDWGIKSSTKPISSVSLVNSVSQISPDEINRARLHANWLSEPYRDIFFSKNCFSDKDVPLVAVHATDYLPQNGMISPGGPSKDLAGRRTIHFGLNGIATASFISTTDMWNKKKYYVVAPLADLIEHNKPIGGLAADFFFPGSVHLTDTTQVFTSRDAAEEYVGKMGKLLSLGKRGWPGPEYSEELKLSASLGLWEGLHSDHHFSDYERARSNGNSHEVALQRALNSHDWFYSDASIDPRFEIQGSPPLGPVKVLVSGRMSRNEARIAKQRDFALLGYDCPQQV